MTATRSNGINILLYIFVPVQIMSVYGVIMEQTEFIFLSLYNAIAIFAHVHYGYCVVSCCLYVVIIVDWLLYRLDRYVLI